MVAFGVTDAKAAFAPYADPLIFLFIGGFFIAHAMMRHGLDRRIAASMLRRASVGKSPTPRSLGDDGHRVRPLDVDKQHGCLRDLAADLDGDARE